MVEDQLRPLQRQLSQDTLNIEELRSFVDAFCKIKILNREKPFKRGDGLESEIFFNDLNIIQKSLLNNKALGMDVNVWETAGLKRDEVRNSKVLSWCLNPRANHGQKDIFLKQFLSLLPEQFSEPSCIDSHVIAESCILGNQSDRVDIEIESDQFLLIIEVKIDAPEGPEQLARYLHAAQVKAKMKDWAVIYLTKEGKLPEEYKKRQNIFALSWRQIAEKFMQLPLGPSCGINNRGIWLVQQFALHIDQL